MDTQNNYFFRSIEKIKKDIDSSTHIEGIHKYIIYFSLLDVLGKYAFHNEKDHSRRYKRLIQCFSNWKYKNHISSLQLECILGQINKDLATLIKNKLTPLTYDIQMNRVIDADEVDFTKDKMTEGLSESELLIYNKNISTIYQAKYDNLFYRLRCFIVHEHRVPTPNATDFDENSLIPQYVCFDNSYRLWFSPKIISIILDECIEKVKLINGINYDDVFKPIPKCWIGKQI